MLTPPIHTSLTLLLRPWSHRTTLASLTDSAQGLPYLDQPGLSANHGVQLDTNQVLSDTVPGSLSW